MKRTRRVEVIRYSRRSTLISNEVGLEAELADEQAAIDVLLGMARMVEPSIEETGRAPRQLTGAHVPCSIRSGRFRRFFKRLIQG